MNTTEKGYCQRTRVACPWYKPGNNLTRLVPDYYLHVTDKWLVFPHELADLTEEEIEEGKPAIGRLLDRTFHRGS